MSAGLNLVTAVHLLIPAIAISWERRENKGEMKNTNEQKIVKKVKVSGTMQPKFLQQYKVDFEWIQDQLSW